MTDPSVQAESAAIAIPRRLDPEDAQLALQQLQTILKRTEVVETLAHRQYEDDDKSYLLEGLLHRQHESEIKAIVNDLRSEEHTSELQSLMRISYAVYCLQKKTQKK